MEVLVPEEHTLGVVLMLLVPVTVELREGQVDGETERVGDVLREGLVETVRVVEYVVD